MNKLILMMYVRLIAMELVFLGLAWFFDWDKVVLGIAFGYTYCWVWTMVTIMMAQNSKDITLKV